jgi:hypothetical protein
VQVGRTQAVVIAHESHFISPRWAPAAAGLAPRSSWGSLLGPCG